MRFVLPHDAVPVFETVVPMRWGDMDTMGHINNTLYFRYMEICRLDWIFRLSGHPVLEGQGPVVINAFCNFLRQLSYPGELRVSLLVARPGRSSFETYHRITRVDETDGESYAEGGAKIVWTDYAQRKSVALPQWMRAALSPGDAAAEGSGHSAIGAAGLQGALVGGPGVDAGEPVG